MTIYYVLWPKESDAQFRTHYFNIVGEVVEEFPLSNDTHYQLGSSRLNEEEITNLLDIEGVAISDSAVIAPPTRQFQVDGDEITFLD